jgi:hypothetical protein
MWKKTRETAAERLALIGAGSEISHAIAMMEVLNKPLALREEGSRGW